MPTKIYGASDDLVEFDGDVYGEVGFYGREDDAHGLLIVLSDGTILEAKYGKGGRAIWGLQCIKKGSCFLGIEPCCDEDGDPHSDLATFADGLTWAYTADSWDVVK